MVTTHQGMSSRNLILLAIIFVAIAITGLAVGLFDFNVEFAGLDKEDWMWLGMGFIGIFGFILLLKSFGISSIGGFRLPRF